MSICLTFPIHKFTKLLSEYGTKLIARNIFNQRPIVINKISSNSGTNYKNYHHQHHIRCAKLHLYLFSFSAKVILASFTSSGVSVHSSTNLSTNFFCTYNFYSLNVFQHHTLYHIHTHNY